MQLGGSGCSAHRCTHSAAAASRSPTHARGGAGGAAPAGGSAAAAPALRAGLLPCLLAGFPDGGGPALLAQQTYLGLL